MQDLPDEITLADVSAGLGDEAEWRAVAFLVHRSLVFAKSLDDERRQLDCATAAFALGFLQNELRLNLGEGMPDGDLFAVEVDGVPTGAEQLPLTHACAQGEREKGVQAARLGGVQKLLALVRRQNLNLFLTR